MTQNTRPRIRAALAGAVIALGLLDACSAEREIHRPITEEDSPSATSKMLPQRVIQEDDPSWSCVDDGNRVCGPGNTEHKPAGCYDDGGVLEFQWPCNAWTPDMGYRHPDGTTTFPNGDVMDDEANVLVVGDHSHDIPTA